STHVSILLHLRSASSPRSTLFPYTTLFRSAGDRNRLPGAWSAAGAPDRHYLTVPLYGTVIPRRCQSPSDELPCRALRRQGERARSEEHTSELQSHLNLVCRLLLEKKKLSKR